MFRDDIYREVNVQARNSGNKSAFMLGDLRKFVAALEGVSDGMYVPLTTESGVHMINTRVQINQEASLQRALKKLQEDDIKP